VAGFLKVRDQLATTPEGGAAVYAVAQAVYVQDAEVGLQCLTIATARKWLTADPQGYKGFSLSRMEQSNLKMRIAAKPYLARSYFQGTSPENGYSLPAGDLTVAIRQQPIDPVKDEGTKLFVHSTGADSPRPIVLSKNNRGLWKAHNWSSLQVGCRPPVEAVDDDL
jgi:hypothetical protein